MTEIALPTLVGAAGFAAGMVFGGTAQATGFCTMGALSDALFLSDWRRMRAWVMAMAVSIVGAQTLHAVGLIDLGRSIYLSGPITWAGAVLGGLVFGYGMTLTGGCGSKTLVRLGAGNLKSLVVLLMVGLFATMTLRGLLAFGRVGLDQATGITLAGSAFADQSLAALLAGFGLAKPAARWLPVVVVAGGAAAWCLKDAAFRSSFPHLGAGVILGLTIPAGWAITGILGADEFEPTPLASFSFIAPLGESLIYLMTFTGATISFGIAAVAGVIAGSFAAARLGGGFHLEGFADTADLIRHLVGGALMGSGGVLAMGCTIGQGLTGMSTLSLTSLLAVAAIVAGGVIGLRRLEAG
ncbi:Predicted transporter component [Candidatus Terasakiella magnetica]|nr:Predicted transporter component [Candidatus Terasakiella magnetica]